MATRGAKSSVSGQVVALTGANGMLGKALISQMEEDRGYTKVIAFDLQKPDLSLTKTIYHRVDLTLPDADQRIAQVLRTEGVDSFVHLAFLSDFTHRTDWAHELETIGTMHVLNASSESKLRKFVLWSQGICYGANPQNPAYLREDHPLSGASGPNDTFFADKIDAEQQVRHFAAERSEVTVTVLRMAPILHPESRNFISRMLQSTYVPLLFGYDPLVQFLHLADAVRVLKQVLDDDHPGVFNIAADGVLPLRTVTGLLGRVPIPVPHPLARRLAGALWMGQVVDVPPSFLNFLRYPCVLDTNRARQQLNFVPEYSIHEILAEMTAGQDKPSEGLSRSV